MGRVRLLDVSRGRFLVVADAPLDRYGEDAVRPGLSGLDWGPRAAGPRESVVESFIAAAAVLPMKLFTIFTSDDRALEHVQRDASRIDALLRRVANHHEWGVRVLLDRARAATPPAVKRGRPAVASGRGYLAQKKAQRDEAAELARHARDTVADLYDRLAKQSGLAKRPTVGELPVQGGPLVPHAAFLVPTTRPRRFHSLAGPQA